MEAIKVFLLTVLVFGVLIFVHELGHFIACRIFGVRVNEFAIGMGPKLLSWVNKKSGTVYSLRILPIGGFNSIEDGSDAATEEQPNENSELTDEKKELPEYAFGAKPVWQRMIIIVSGALMNLLLGLIIMTVVVIGTEKYASNTIAYFVDPVTGVEIESFCGMQSGDKIVKVGSRSVHTADELAYSIFAEGAEPTDVVIKRNGQRIVIENVSFPTEEKDGIIYGIINFKVYAEEKNFVNTVKQSFYGSANVVTQVYDSLFGMITGKYGIQHVSGPIGVGEVIGEAAKLGYSSLLTISVVLSMNLGVFNLIPIPGLDGGKLVFLIIEAIIRRPVPKKIEENITVIGITLLMALVIAVAFKDVFAIIFRR